jgi:hypothetical protein
LGGDLLGAPGEFVTGQRLQNQTSDEAIAKQGDFFSFVFHGVFSPASKLKRQAPRFRDKWFVCGLRQAPPRE